MRVIKNQNVTCEYRSWFKKNLAYLTLQLFDNGHWRIKSNDNYQERYISRKDWKIIKRQCKEKIQVTQRYVLKTHYNQKYYRNEYYCKKDDNKLKVKHSTCIDIIEKEYDLLFEGKV